MCTNALPVIIGSHWALPGCIWKHAHQANLSAHGCCLCMQVPLHKSSVPHFGTASVQLKSMQGRCPPEEYAEVRCLC